MSSENTKSTDEFNKNMQDLYVENYATMIGKIKEHWIRRPNIVQMSIPHNSIYRRIKVILIETKQEFFFFLVIIDNLVL